MAKKTKQEPEADRRFAIVAARYGTAWDEDASEDVMAAVAKLVKNDRLVVPKVDGAALGARRAYAGRCRLYVTFTVGEQELRGSAAQGKELRLP